MIFSEKKKRREFKKGNFSGKKNVGNLKRKVFLTKNVGNLKRNFFSKKIDLNFLFFLQK